MSEAERSSDLAALLSRAKKAEPGPERLARVLERLEGELGPLEIASPAGVAGAPTPAGAAPRSAGWLGPGLAALGVLALLFLGWRAWPTSTPEGRPNSDPRAEAPTGGEARAGAASDLGDVAAETTERGALPAGSGVPPVEVTPIEEALVEVIEAAPIERARSERSPTERPSEEAIVPLDEPGSTLREEIAILDLALSAWRRGDRDGAREALARHRARFPEGILAPERERLEGEVARSEDPASPLAPSPVLDEPLPSP